MSAAGRKTRQLRAALGASSDTALLRVVGLLDGLAERGEADELLDTLRRRLRRLSPARPMRFARVLALPLEGALVPPTAWTRAPAELPRSALAPIAQAMRAALGPLAAELDAAMADRRMTDEAAVDELGPRLWDAAAPAELPELAPAWAAAGLPLDALAPSLALCRPLWRHGEALWGACRALAEGNAAAELRAVLEKLAAAGAAPFTAGLALLMRRAAGPAEVAAAATSISPGMARAAERMLEEVLDGQAAVVATAETAPEMTAALAALDRLLTEAEAVGPPLFMEARRRRAALLRRKAMDACLHCFAEALVRDLLTTAEAAAAGPPAEDAAVAALEEAARDLRALEAAGRRHGQEAGFDRALRDAGRRLQALGAADGGLSRVDIARLVEIIAGTEAALPLLPPGRAG